jgi:hypothetical protein
MDGLQGPGLLEPTAGVSLLMCCAPGDLADLSTHLHTAGPDNQDLDIILDLLGPAAIGSGPCRSRSKESDKDQLESWMEQVKGGGKKGWDGPGRLRYGVMGKWCYS